MNLSRRSLLGSLGGLTAISLLTARDASTSDTELDDAAAAFPDRHGTYLNSASVHPISARSIAAVQRYLVGKAEGGSAAVDTSAIHGNFARLINADVDEVCYVPSTSIGENLVAFSLDLPGSGGRVVTDALHFVGSFYIYEQLQKDGVDVVVIPMEDDGTIDIARYDEAITEDTRLVALSHVSFVNGFEHDLKAISEIAHSRGALVYADIIQSAGAIPVDARETDVDFAGCGTYKWLMGDFGLAFLYVKRDVQDQLQRPWYGCKRRLAGTFC